MSLSADQHKAMAHPLRLRVLEALEQTPDGLTNQQLAERLGVAPGRLHWHTQMLVGYGLVTATPQGRRVLLQKVRR